MPFKFNETTNAIEMATGDTGNIPVTVNYGALSPGDVILFAIFEPNEGDLMCKATELVEGTANIRLCSHDTCDLEPGNYHWNLRIVTSPVYDEDGNVCVDECTDDVITIFDSPPKIKLKRGGAYVGRKS